MRTDSSLLRVLVRAALALALTACSAGGNDSGDARPLGNRWGNLAFTPCSLSGAGSGRNGIEARCTVLAVPENPDAPDGRKIALNIAWVPASNETAPPPIRCSCSPAAPARPRWPPGRGNGRR